MQLPARQSKHEAMLRTETQTLAESSLTLHPEKTQRFCPRVTPGNRELSEIPLVPTSHPCTLESPESNAGQTPNKMLHKDQGVQEASNSPIIFCEVTERLEMIPTSLLSPPHLLNLTWQVFLNQVTWKPVALGNGEKFRYAFFIKRSYPRNEKKATLPGESFN